MFSKLKNLKMPWPNSSLYLGLEILDTAFPKFLVLKKKAQDLSLYDCGSITNLQELLGRYKNKVKRIAVSLPRSKCVLRMIEVPAGDAPSVASAVETEIERHIPFDLQEASYQYQVLDFRKNKALVLFAAVRKEQLQSYMTVLQSLKLNRALLNVSTTATFQSVVFNYKEKLANSEYYILNIGMEHVEIEIISSGRLLFSKSIKLGAEYLSRLISEELSMKFAMAQQLVFAGDLFAQKVDGRENQEKVKKCLETWLMSLIKEIDLSIRFFSVKYGKRINAMLLCGCLPELDVIAERLSTAFQLEASPMDSVQSLVIDESSDLTADQIDSSKLIVPMGLALASAGQTSLTMDFFPQEILKKRKRKNHRLIAWVLSVCLLLSFAVGSVYVRKQYKTAQVEYQSADLRLDNVRSKLKELKKWSTIKQTIEGAHVQGSGVYLTLNALVQNLPKGVFVQKLRYEDGQEVFIDGMAASHQLVLKFMQLLRRSGLFEQLVLIDSSNQHEDQAQEQVFFSLQGRLQ